ncbi:MAG TPA: AsnC family transcriptional regulator [Syntrophales bacterium]|nr:AsnC family transcriptional regulator [Syntrophales bacterium]HON22171.1 AsnC family transcriptional regulator [Syntrophales bacterium]HOU77379.1 AsnC family transcriptional regulator [Syntrophales bacterium]HPC32499.1 AsnC family transcriptional regulator [Syntrophales bacterium]HQG34120.1 AsnC family transcriptional regulator [Syntrophales bacterium]
MDETDRKILQILQDEFPLVPAPFRAVAERLGRDEAEVLERVRKMKEAGVIRRIGATFNPRALGFVSTLCAARVPVEKLASFTAVVNASPFVTHHYRRDHEYNLWFTVIAPSAAARDDFLRQVKDKTGITDILDMPAVRTFKIDARFPV